MSLSGFLTTTMFRIQGEGFITLAITLMVSSSFILRFCSPLTGMGTRREFLALLWHLDPCQCDRYQLAFQDQTIHSDIREDLLLIKRTTNANVDALSRLPLSKMPESVSVASFALRTSGPHPNQITSYPRMDQARSCSLKSAPAYT